MIYDECGDGPDCFAAFEGAVFDALAEVGQGGRFGWAFGAGHEVPSTQPDLAYSTIDEVYQRPTLTRRRESA